MLFCKRSVAMKTHKETCMFKYNFSKTGVFDDLLFRKFTLSKAV